jgi:hypothetical protein
MPRWLIELTEDKFINGNDSYLFVILLFLNREYKLMLIGIYYTNIFTNSYF